MEIYSQKFQSETCFRKAITFSVFPVQKPEKNYKKVVSVNLRGIFSPELLHKIGDMIRKIKGNVLPPVTHLSTNKCSRGDRG